MRFNFNHLHYFHIVASEGSLARAAERLGLAQSTLSTQVRQLERDLEGELFHRNPDGMRLTDLGRQVFRHTDVMFRASDRLAEIFNADGEDVPQSFLVGVDASVSSSTAATFLVPILELEGCFPRVFSGNTDSLLRLMLADEVDLVLLHQEPPFSKDRGIEVVEVHTPSLVGVCARNVLKEGEHCLDKVPLLQYPPTSPYRWYIESYLREHSLHPTILGEVADVSLMLAAVLKGVCAAFIPSSVINAANLGGELNRFAQLDRLEARIFAIYRELQASQTVHRAVRSLIETHQTQV
ncbi:LysR family transcriptional regulator [Haliangium ochraceum]|uniref:Transcriptional regulator, LysR family n=1 Tax=Haliangium ochraceum (strain DSM 14365 / JCM 11303 / SMP-2) TaxID=502025 RepID=D0LSU9_HALO1|nr:LysR family transcriptional regulator [Haliangium ochraceum]ACY17321.1 transcriptional regulator, LysR family [Haliangium ochraceum DSM 14365]